MTIVEVFLLLGGIGMFLYGMHIMGDGLKGVAGDRLRVILEQATRNRVLGILLGTGVTMLIQSSGATTVMTIGFVSAGLMTLNQALSVIMGANIGTTVTSQIIAFDFGSFAPFIVFVGAVMLLFFRKKFIHNLGLIVLGFGLLFMGISTMGDAIAPLKESEEFTSMLLKMSNPFLALLIGIVFTAILQSSSSSVGIIQTFAIQGLLDVRFAVFMVIGTSIGACVPAVIAALASSRDGKRAAMLSVIFNVIRTVICFVPMLLFPGILTAIMRLSPDDPARQIANAHVLMAIFAVIVEVPFASQIVKLTQRFLPVTAEESRRVEKKLVYITNLDVPPAIALSQARHEVCRMAHITKENLELSLEAFFERNADKIETVEETEQTINYLNHAITSALVTIRSGALSEDELAQIGTMILTISDIERIGDHAENITEYAQMAIDENVTFSDDANDELLALTDSVVQAVSLAIDIYENQRFDQLTVAEDLEEFIDEQKQTCIDHHIARLMKEQCNPRSGLIFTDMATDLERCADHANNIANYIQHSAAANYPA
jgi:phosphate:Na+ symporter